MTKKQLKELAVERAALDLCAKLRLVEHEEHLQPLRLLIMRGYKPAQIIAGYTVPAFAD